MYGPGYANFDMTVNRKIPLGHNERRQLQLKVEAFNVFNHTQFTGVNSAFTYNAAGVNTNANIGALTGERGSRIVSLEMRVQFCKIAPRNLPGLTAFCHLQRCGFRFRIRTLAAISNAQGRGIIAQSSQRQSHS
jgi:hypothetical protein